MKINYLDDCFKLQSDLDNFVVLFDKLVLSLNLGKWKAMTFIRICSLLLFSYYIHDSVICCYYEFVIDLGFKLFSNLDPVHHIVKVCYRDLRVLGIKIRFNKLVCYFTLIYHIIKSPPQYNTSYKLVVRESYTTTLLHNL